MHLVCALALKIFVCQNLLDHSVNHCFRIVIVLLISLLSQAVGNSTTEFLGKQTKLRFIFLRSKLVDLHWLPSFDFVLLMIHGEVHIPQLVKSSHTEQIICLVVLTETVQVTAHVDHLIASCSVPTSVRFHHHRLVLGFLCILIGELLGDLLHLTADSLPLSLILFLYF